MKKITIGNVAKKAGVSIATVSRVLNKQTGYSESTRKKVLNVMKEMGYQPNALAQGLAGKRINTIGVLIPKLSSMVASTILNGIEDAAHKREHSIIICNTDNDGKRTNKYLQVLKQKQIEGLIVVSQMLTTDDNITIENMNIPVILISTLNDNFTYIKVDDYKASYESTEFLIRKGHHSIVLLAGTKGDQVSGISRLEGYKDALDKYGIKFKRELVFYGDFSYESGKVNMEKALNNDIDFTAVYAVSDDMAVGALNIAYDHGIKVPDELSIMSYDGTKLTEMSTPPLTALEQPFYKMGFEGLNMLIKKIDGNQIDSRYISHSIIDRGSIKTIK